MSAITFHDASGRCASPTPTLQETTCRILLLYPTLHLTFHAESIDADPSAEDGTIFFFLLPLHFHKLYLLTTCSVQAMHFHTFSFLFCFSQSCEEQTADGHGLPLPASFYYSRYPGGCLTDFWGVTFSLPSLSLTLRYLLHCGLEVSLMWMLWDF
jgi:hypothetical protein